MPRGCTTRAACGGSCFDAEQHAEAMRWTRYWNSLTPDEQTAERASIAAYVAEQKEGES